MARHLTVSLLSALALAACGGTSATSSDSCRLACETLAACGQATCSFSAACTTREACEADCVRAASSSCGAIDGSDTAAAADLAACRVQCQSLPAPDSGPPHDGPKPADQGSPDHPAGMAADLLINSFGATVSGSSATYTVKVCNVGEATTESFVLGLYHAQPASGCNAAYADHVTINGLGSTACVTKTFKRDNLKADVYEAWARVDPGCKLAELDESNNTASTSYVVGGKLPDLTVKSFKAQPSGSTVTYTVEVCTNHIAIADRIKIGLYWAEWRKSKKPECSTASADGYLSIDGLAANSCQTVTHVRKDVDPGTFTEWVLVDRDCKLKEAVETNNAASVTFTVDGPDYSIKSVTATASKTVVDFVVEVCHSGLSASSSPRIGLFTGYDATSTINCKSTPLDYDYTSIDGGCETVTFQIKSTGPGVPPGTVFTPGKSSATVYVDYDCRVTEKNEQNNRKTVTYTVPGPDLVVKDMTAKVAYWNSSLVVYSAKLCNIGESGTGTFEIYAYKGGPAPTCGSSGAYKIGSTYGSISAGKCSTISANFPTGTGKVWSLADATCTFPEVNEDNNYASTTF